MSNAQPLPQLDPAMLTAVARAALDCPTAVVASWAPPDRLTGALFNVTSGGVYRVRGTTNVGETLRPWSAVLKVLRSPAGTVTPDGTTITEEQAEDGSMFNYWRREALAYQTGLLAGLPPGLAAPRCLAITERADGQLWLWLEDLPAATEPWTLDRYALAARHLGAFNGAYVTGRPLPAAPWLSPAPLESWLAVVVARIMAALDGRGLWQHPLMRLALPGDTAARLHTLWAGREATLAAQRRLPRVFCHLDAFRANLAARRTPTGKDETVAIDWAWAGSGALGEELGPLVVATVLDGALPLDALPALESAALDGYLAGLGEAGWRGDPRLVRLGYTATVPLRYAALLAADIAHAAVDDGFRAAQEERHGASIEAVAHHRGALLAILLDRAGTARALAA